MDVYTKENKEFHRTKSKRLNRNNVHNAKLTKEEVNTIKSLKSQEKNKRSV